MGIEFYYLDKPEMAVKVSTRKRFSDFIAQQWRCGVLDLDNVDYAWKYIRNYNKSGVTPWVYVDPYMSELYYECILNVCSNRDEAQSASDESAENI